MNRLITAGTLGLIMAASGAAGAATPEQDHAELQQLKAQLQALMDRVGELERQNARLMAGNAAGASGGEAPRVAALEQRVAGVEQASGEQAGRIAEAAERDRSLDWAGRLRWNGDFRYRHEQFDIEDTHPDRVRHRIRARLGMSAVLSDTLKAGFQLATGTRGDPRSANATLDDANQRKDIGLDLAYVDWQAFDGAVLTLGKQKKPWFEPGNSLFYDGDVNPEGMALKWAGGSGAFANLWGFWLEESSSLADAKLVGAQLGFEFERIGLTLAAGYWDYGAVQHQPILQFADAPAGNSTFVGGSNCSGLGSTACYTYDYNIVGVDAQWSGRIGSLPITLFAGWLKNTDPDDLDAGYNVGFQLGKAGDPGTWQFGALYQALERDAQFGALLESDFAGGNTQGRGVQLQGAWAPLRNVNLKATLFLNDINYDTASALDYKRLQLDMNYKF